MRPAYIGFRVQRYGPQVTKAVDVSPGTRVVRNLRKMSQPHAANAAPITNSTIPAIVIACEAGQERRPGKTESRPAPTRYVKTKTQGTGIRVNTRIGAMA